jgi:integrase
LLILKHNGLTRLYDFMTVIKRGNSFWVDIGINRRRYRKRSPANSFKGARNFELFLRNKLARGEQLDAKQETRHRFKDIALRWLNIRVKNNNKPSEYKNRQYMLYASILPQFGSKYIDEITSYSIEQYKSKLLNESKLSPKSINNYLCILSCCLKTAEEWGMLKEIPKIKLLKIPPQKYDYLTEAETEQLLRCAEEMWYDIILLAVKTGLRFGEIIALKWEDIDFRQNILTVNRNIVRGIECSPKNNKSRSIPLSNAIKVMLCNRTRISEYIFHDSKCAPLTYEVSYNRLHKICGLAGLRKIGWHTLRHSFASHLTAKRNSIVAIKELMGHSDVKTTMRYAHVNLPVLQNAIESLDTPSQFHGTIASQIT